MIFSSRYSNLTSKDKKRVIITLGGFLLLAFLATSMASFFVSKDSIRDAIINSELPLTSDTLYSEIQSDLMRPLLISSTMAQDTFLRDWVLAGEQDLGAIQKYLAEVREKYGTITSFFVSERTRKYYYYDGVLKTVNPDEDRDAWYFRVQKMSTPYEINVDPDLANRDTMTIFINYRVFDYDSKFIGAAGVGLTVNMMKSRINDYRQRYKRNIYFLDEGGKLILHNDFAGMDSLVGQNVCKITGLRSLCEEILDHKKSTFEYQRDGQTILLNARFLPELKWYLMVEQVEDDVLAPLQHVLALNMLVCVVVTLLVLVIIFRTISWFQRRLEGRYQELEEKNCEIDQQRQRLAAQAESLAEVNRRLEMLHKEKDEWVSIAVHDLKSPLVSISGFLKLMNEQALSPEEFNESSQYVLKSATNMSRMVNNLLNVYAIETARLDVCEPIDVTKLSAEVIEENSPQAHAKQIALEATLPSGPLQISGHQDWMHAIIDNLISNAIKFSSEKTTIEISLTQIDDCMQLIVCDQGPGLTEEDQKQLFSRFARLSAEPTGNESSTGLGLYIVKKVTELMGGKITCHSEPGQGACFTVAIPISDESIA